MMSKKLMNLLNFASKKSDSCELFYLENSVEKVEFQGNELQNTACLQTEGVGVRVIKNGLSGFATSTKMTEEVIENALEISELGDKSDFDFPGNNISFSEDEYICKSIEKINIDDIINKGKKIINEIKKIHKHINIDIRFEKKDEKICLLNSRGFTGSYRKNYYSMFLIAKLTGKNDIFEIWKIFSDSKRAGKEEQSVGEILFDLEHGMNVVKIEAGKYPVLFTPDALVFLLFSFISGIRGDNILKKTSPLRSKAGQKIFDERISIYDDGTFPGGVGYRPFADEGVKTQKTVLVDRGVIKNFLSDLKTGSKLNIPSTGNGFRREDLQGCSYTGYPDIRHTTLIIDPGKTPFIQLLSNIKNGLFIKMAPNFADGDIDSGDFSGNIFHGYRVEKGKITGRVKNTVVSGNIYRLFGEQLIEISSERNFCCMSDFKLPFMLFKDVEVTS